MDDELLDALELGSLALPWLDGHTERLDIDGVLARSSAISSPYVNLVSMTRLDAQIADDVIVEIRDHFAARGHVFAWITGSRTRPIDMPDRLQRAGFTLLTGYAGMVCEDLDTPIAAPNDVVIEEIDARGIEALDAIKAAAFGMPLPAAHWIDELLLKGLGGRVRVYLARAKDDSEWSAFGQCWYAPGMPIVILGGGGVLPRARGQGLFRALVARRVADARADGIRAATMQAMDSTSAPIMRRLGFREHAHLDMWQWQA